MSVKANKVYNLLFSKNKKKKPNILAQEIRNVLVIGKTDDKYILKNYEDIEIEYPKYLVVENELEIKDGQLQLSESMYRHWFTSKKKEILECLYQVFEDNLQVVIDNKHIILENPNYFKIRVPLFYVSTRYRGGYYLSIGAWLAHFDEFVYELIDTKTEEIIKGHLAVSREYGSMHNLYGWTYKFWNNERKETINTRFEQHNKDIIGKPKGIWNKFAEISSKYQSKETVPRVIQLKALLVELGIDISHCISRTKAKS